MGCTSEKVANSVILMQICAISEHVQRSDVGLWTHLYNSLLPFLGQSLHSTAISKCFNKAVLLIKSYSAIFTTSNHSNSSLNGSLKGFAELRPFIPSKPCLLRRVEDRISSSRKVHLTSLELYSECKVTVAAIYKVFTVSIFMPLDFLAAAAALQGFAFHHILYVLFILLSLAVSSLI